MPIFIRLMNILTKGTCLMALSISSVNYVYFFEILPTCNLPGYILQNSTAWVALVDNQIKSLSSSKRLKTKSNIFSLIQISDSSLIIRQNPNIHCRELVACYPVFGIISQNILIRPDLAFELDSKVSEPYTQSNILMSYSEVSERSLTCG